MSTATEKRLFTEDNQMTATAIAERDANPSAANPLALIQAAIDKGLDPDQLGKLFELQERWEKNEAKRAYAEAMTAAQGEMRPVVRGRINEQQRSKYAALEDIHDAIKPIWLKHGFTLSYGSDQSPYPEHYRVVCECLHEGGHSTHHVLDGPPDEKGIKGNANKTAIQAMTSTVTYLRRSLAVMIFDVTLVNTDTDGQRSVPVISEEQEATIRTLIEQFPDPAGELTAFLRAFAVEKISDLAEVRFGDACSKIRGRLNAHRRV